MLVRITNVLLVKRLRILDDDQITSSNGFLLVRIIDVQLVKQLRVDMATNNFLQRSFVGSNHRRTAGKTAESWMATKQFPPMYFTGYVCKL